MKGKSIILVIFCLLATSVFCQHNVTISGKLKMKPGTTIRFSKYSDYISLEQKRLSTVKTGNDSCFSVTFPLQIPELIKISINELNLEGLFYPDLHYKTDLASTNNDHEGNLVIVSCNQPQNPELVVRKTYTVFSDSIISILINQNNQRATKKSVDQFNAAVDIALQQTTDTFCKNIIQSLRVDYLTMSRAVSFSSAFNSSFNCTKLPLDNPALQSLLNSKFRLYFSSAPPAVTRLNLFQGIPDSLHFSDLLQIISVDPSLNCMPVREYVLLENLYSLIKNRVLNPERGIKLFKEASLSATHATNRQVANNLINTINRQNSITTIPDFSLLFPDGSTHLLSSLKGKPLHITFFTLKGIADRTLLSQLSVVEHLADSLGIAHFLCITADVNHEAVKKYWSDRKLPMQLSFAPDDYEIIDFFNAYSLPCFVLLDSKGRINNMVPSFPGDQLLKQLMSLNKEETAIPTDTIHQ